MWVEVRVELILRLDKLKFFLRLDKLKLILRLEELNGFRKIDGDIRICTTN
jgi:hypothetical protein